MKGRKSSRARQRERLGCDEIIAKAITDLMEALELREPSELSSLRKGGWALL